MHKLYLIQGQSDNIDLSTQTAQEFIKLRTPERKQSIAMHLGIHASLFEVPIHNAQSNK